MALEFSERQKSTIAVAITVLSTLVILSTVAMLLFLIGLFFSTFSTVFLPVAVAGVLALVLKPAYDWLTRWRFIPDIVAVVLVFLSILIPFAALAWFFGAVIVDQLRDLASRLPQWWAAASDFVSQHLPEVVEFWQNHPVGERIRTTFQDQQGQILGGIQLFGGKALSAGAGVLRGFATLFAWAVLPVYVAFFLLSKPRIESETFLPFLRAETRRDVMYLATEFVNIVVAFFRGQLLIALLQGMLFAAGFSLAGLKYGLVLGLMLGLLNIIPYLGSMVGLGISLPLAFFQPEGGLWTLLWVLAVFTLVQMIEGYFLTPKIMGDRTGLHPMVIMIAIFFWGSALGGITGMILAIPLTAFLVVFWRLAREKYIGELV